MTCIGQRKPAILPEYVHMLCTHQSVQQNFSVRSKSYSAVYFDSRGYFVFMDLYSTAAAILRLWIYIRQLRLFFMLRLLLVYILENAECKKYISFMMKKSEKSKKMKKYIDKIK